MKRPLVPWDGDTLKDIGDIPFSDWWKRCEDLLPEDWAMQLVCRPHADFLVYSAMAFLLEDDEDITVGRQTTWCSTPERAMEGMFYALRDSLLSPLTLTWSDASEDEGGEGDEERTTSQRHAGDGQGGCLEDES